MYKTIKEAAELGKKMGYDVIMEKDGMYGAARWSDVEYIKSCGGKYVCSIESALESLDK